MQHIKEAARTVKLQERGPHRHQQDIGRCQTVDGQISQGRGGIDKDQIIAVQQPIFGQNIRQCIPQLPASPLHAPDRDLEFSPIEVQLRPYKVNIGPVRILDQILGAGSQRFVQRVVDRHGIVAPIQSQLIVTTQVLCVMARH